MDNYATEHNKNYLGRNITSAQYKHCLATADKLRGMFGACHKQPNLSQS